MRCFICLLQIKLPAFLVLICFSTCPTPLEFFLIIFLVASLIFSVSTMYKKKEKENSNIVTCGYMYILQLKLPVFLVLFCFETCPRRFTFVLITFVFCVCGILLKKGIFVLFFWDSSLLHELFGASCT